VPLDKSEGVVNVLLLAHFTGPNLRGIADPNVASCCAGHLHKPLAVPGGFHPNPGMPEQSTVKRLSVQL
jgi:hypothetical protein